MDAFPSPDLSWPPARAFWSSAAEGVLGLPRCTRCNAAVWYPEYDCTRCGGDEVAWTPTDGRGSLFTWVVVHHAFLSAFEGGTPFVVGLVTLDSDPEVRIVSLIVDVDPDTPRVGMELEAVFRPLPFPRAPQDLVAPLFGPRGPRDD